MLRHTAATLMLVGGVPVHVAAARLGDRAETALQVYAHLLPRSDEQAAQTTAAALTTFREQSVSKCPDAGNGGAKRPRVR